ncbi:branched-chain amino acid ABC transporter substrate-binding protein [Flavitalea flava]
METITIGIACPLSGPSATLGQEMKQAIELAIEEKNAQGGIAGRTIRAIVKDDAGKVINAQEIAGYFAGESDLCGVIGHYGSDTSIAAAKICQENDLALVAPIASNPVLTSSQFVNVYRYTNRDDHTAEAISHYLYHGMNKRKAIIFKTHTPYGNSMAGQFETAFMREHGRIVDSLTVYEGEQDFDELIRTSFKKKDIDLVFYGGSFEGAYLLKAIRRAGYNQLLATGDGCWDRLNFLEPAGRAAEQGEGVLVLSASSAIGDVEGSLDFAKKYEARYGPIINYALNAYDAASVLIKAMEQTPVSAGRLPGRREIIETLKQISFRGIANPNPLVWDHNGDNTNAITRLNIVKGGKFVEDACINRAVSPDLAKIPSL